MDPETMAMVQALMQGGGGPQAPGGAPDPTQLAALSAQGGGVGVPGPFGAQQPTDFQQPPPSMYAAMMQQPPFAPPY